jgi:hypothetical protein
VRLVCDSVSARVRQSNITMTPSSMKPNAHIAENRGRQFHRVRFRVRQSRIRLRSEIDPSDGQQCHPPLFRESFRFRRVPARHFGISRQAFCRWKRRYAGHGEAGLWGPSAAAASVAAAAGLRSAFGSYGKPDIPKADATRTGREEIECSTVPGQCRRSLVCGTVKRSAGINWRGPAI